LIFLSGVAASAYFFDTSLTVGETGISFPMFLSPRLNLRRDRLWTELRKISLVRKAKRPLEKSRIVFHIGKNLSVPINLAYLKPKDLEMLLLALGIWAQRTETDNEVKLLQENLADKKTGTAGGDSYTEMWEKELNRRFSSTCFVPLQPGHLLKDGTLSVVKQLAFGGMSAVYLAQLNRTDLRVLKEFVVPNSDPRLQEKAHELFEREAKLLMKLSHSRLAHVYDHFVEEGRTYLLLDYIPGTDLRQIVVQKGAQKEELVVDWILQVCEVLSYLHAQNPPVIHRDLTPDNLLLTAQEQIMLIDFGAANEFVGTATGTLVGKESFISPEQFRGDTVPQSDIYSLGATMHYLLTGEEPSPLSQSFPQRVKPELSDWINNIVANCTNFESAERIQTVQDLESSLRIRELAPVPQEAT
jgi:tRNA A-37 threonylcarbamoyl transferase component Bud32